MAKAKAKKKSGSFRESAFRDIELYVLPCKKIKVAKFMSGPKIIGIASRPVYIVGPPAKVEKLIGLVRKGMS